MSRDKQFPEFERRLEKGAPVPYHELWDQRADIIGGGALAFLGTIPLIWLNPDFVTGIFQILGLIAIFIGVLVLGRGLIVYRRLIKQYSFHGLTRKKMSEAIMYIDAQLAQTDEFDSPVHYHGKTPVTKYKMSLNRLSFEEFLVNTAGLITWPSKIMKEHETDVREDKKAFYYMVSLLVVVIIVVVVIIWYAISLWDWSLLILVFIPVYCSLQTSWCLIPHIYTLHRYYIKDEWITKVRQSDTVQLNGSLDEIFQLLQSEFPYPLKLELVREYPQLAYTGRKRLSYTLVNLKEAVLYPSIPQSPI